MIAYMVFDPQGNPMLHTLRARESWAIHAACESGPAPWDERDWKDLMQKGYILRTVEIREWNEDDL